VRLSRWRVEWFRYAERRGRLICGLAVAKASNHPPYGASGLEVKRPPFGRGCGHHGSSPRRGGLRSARVWAVLV
jgi:hypothetical protein